MNLNEVYKDKKKIIGKVMSQAMSKLFDEIENDDDYDLSTDENIELCEDLFTMWCKGGENVKL